MARSGEDVESFCDVAELAEVVYKEEPLKGPSWPLVSSTQPTSARL